MTRVPGAAQHGAKRSGALQTRDPGFCPREESNRGPASAVHRCALHRARDTQPMCHLICVPPARVHEFWPHARALIKAAMERGDISPFVCVEHAVLTGDALLWLAWDADARAIAAACVTELQKVGARKFCGIVGCGGKDMHRWLPLLAGVEDYARAEGCAAMRIMGRAGWARILPDYRRKRVILEKQLDES
jgi:hypothetical protein